MEVKIASSSLHSLYSAASGIPGQPTHLIYDFKPIASPSQADDRVFPQNQITRTSITY